MRVWTLGRKSFQPAEGIVQRTQDLSVRRFWLLIMVHLELLEISLRADQRVRPRPTLAPIHGSEVSDRYSADPAARRDCTGSRVRTCFDPRPRLWQQRCDPFPHPHRLLSRALAGPSVCRQRLVLCGTNCRSVAIRSTPSKNSSQNLRFQPDEPIVGGFAQGAPLRAASSIRQTSSALNPPEPVYISRGGAVVAVSPKSGRGPVSLFSGDGIADVQDDYPCRTPLGGQRGIAP